MIHLDKQEFMIWLRGQGAWLGRANRAGQTPLELFILDHFKDQVNWTACAIPISLTKYGLWVYTKTGLTRVMVPIWADQFVRRSATLMEQYRAGFMPSVGLGGCLDILNADDQRVIAPKSLDAIMSELMAMLRK